jgi:hypothetical protein
MCFGNFILEQEMDLEKDYSLLLGVRKFGVKQNHNTMWGWVWNDKICYNNATKFVSFSNEFFCFIFLNFYFCVRVWFLFLFVHVLLFLF